MSDYEVPAGKPLGNKILIKILPKKEKTSGGLILVEDSRNLIEVVVINVSDQVTTVQQFDKLLIPSGCGVEHELEGNNYRFILDNDPFYLL